MLKDLLPLLRKGDTLILTVAMEGDDQFRVNVTPKLFTLDGDQGADRLALNQPVCITGTAAELDSPEFTATLRRFTAATNTHRHTIDEVEAAHATAAEEKKKAGDAKLAKIAKPAEKAAAKPAKPEAPAKPKEAPAKVTVASATKPLI